MEEQIEFKIREQRDVQRGVEKDSSSACLVI